ncbi:MAG: hypothetical protein LBP63_07850 [Prevotellaceae bacterium]|jgi:hypothetical protein|nr:hypothetical protein [Prevotellaceae bacterium]
MDNILQNIVSLFSSVQLNKANIIEDYSEVKIIINCPNGKCPTEADLQVVLSELNPRESLHFSILENGEVVENYDTSTNSDFMEYVNTCSDCLNRGNFELKVIIVKNINAQTVSIYYLDKFIEYLSNQPIIFFLDKINETFNGNDFVIFEMQDNFSSEFSTQTIKFIHRGHQATNNSNVNRIEKINKTKNLCHCNIVSKYQFIPDDFFPINKNNIALDKIFCRYSLLYSAIFLFDIFNIDGSNVEYKLNGYKTLNQKLTFLDIDISSYVIYFQIYNWVYDGGNIVDKIGLARNILSLNFDKENLKLSKPVFEAIKSGFKIYQKENIKQYIDIRNKISDQLVELQNKADKIVENFVSDYKKTFLAVVSFFISVIVIRVVSKGDFIGGFTKEVTFLTFGFLLISLFVMCFALWEINVQLKRYKKFYENLKVRYTDLLDESDIERILNNNKDFNCNKRFIKRKRNAYTILWIISLLLLFFIVLYVSNLNVCEIEKSFVCCIKNIL